MIKNIHFLKNENIVVFPDLRTFSLFNSFFFSVEIIYEWLFLI